MSSCRQCHFCPSKLSEFGPVTQPLWASPPAKESWQQCPPPGVTKRMGYVYNVWHWHRLGKRLVSCRPWPCYRCPFHPVLAALLGIPRPVGGTLEQASPPPHPSLPVPGMVAVQAPVLTCSYPFWRPRAAGGSRPCWPCWHRRPAPAGTPPHPHAHSCRPHRGLTRCRWPAC